MQPERLFAGVASFSVRHPRIVLGAALVGVALALLFAGTRLTLKTSNLDLIDPDLPTVKAFSDFAAEFGTPNVLVVGFEGDDPEKLREAVDRVGGQVRSLPGVSRVMDRLPADEDVLAVAGMDPYIASDDGGLLFVIVQPDDPHSSAETIAPFVEGVRGVLVDEDVEGLGVRTSLTGMPEYAINDRDVIQKDISRLSVASLALVLLLFVTAFRSLRRPALAVGTLLVGVCLTLGIVTLYPGHLTLLSAFFASILFGLGVDYGIHVVNRVEELAGAGVVRADAIPGAVESLARGLATGALTTSFVFFSMEFSGFRGFEELGLIAGIGVLVCLASMITVLPALLAFFGPRRARAPSRSRAWIGPALRALQRGPLPWVLALCALLIPIAGGPGFDSDYLNLQPRDSEAVRLEREMVRRSDLSPQFAVFVKDSREEALALADALLFDDTVGEVRSIRNIEELSPLGGGESRVPDSVLTAFRSREGRYAVYAYPAGDIWNPEEKEAFLSHMRALDEGVTGLPVLGSFMVDRSKRALFVTAALGAFLLLVWTVADFRDPRLALIASLPTVLTVTSMLALMRLFDVPFNPLNVMALPTVIGIAVDDGVHMLHRFIQERGNLERTLAGTGRSVVLTSATTVAAFGTLAFTSHRGLASFALALVIGVGSALILSVVVLPAVLDRFAGRILLLAGLRDRPD